MPTLSISGPHRPASTRIATHVLASTALASALVTTSVAAAHADVDCGPGNGPTSLSPRTCQSHVTQVVVVSRPAPGAGTHPGRPGLQR